MESWLPVTGPPNSIYTHSTGTKMHVTNQSLPFLTNEPIGGPETQEGVEEPVEVIVSRVLYALLISVSLVANLLLLIAVIRLKAQVPVVYLLLTSLLLPDCIFYTKVIMELINWGVLTPVWAGDSTWCGLWQFLSHLQPLLYSSLLVGTVYQAFIRLFMDTHSVYEASTRRFFPLLLLSITVGLAMVSAPSWLYAKAVLIHGPEGKVNQECQLEVTPIAGVEVTPATSEQAMVTYRLAMEVVLPYLVPAVLVMFPYLSLLVGLLRGLAATEHTCRDTKLHTVVVLWVLTSYLMLMVPNVLRSIFSIFSVWHRLTTLFDAEDDPRIPIFQTYIHMAAYIFTILWGIIRPAVTFKYTPQLRAALGP